MTKCDERPATLETLLQKAKSRLRQALADKPGSTPDLDARLLLSAACGVAHHVPLMDGKRLVAAEDAARLEDFLVRREKSEPVARILGRKEFWGLPFSVTADTLVPRPETEGMVEAVLSWCDAKGRRDDALRIVDFGTGSGVILIALLTELPNATGVAVDLNARAIDVARDNADRNGVGDRFLNVVSNYGDAVTGPVDVLVSNPPYILDGERQTLSADVVDFDPALALFGGADGLDAYREIFPWAVVHLSADGIGIVEHGASQGADVRHLADDHELECIECVLDIAKLPRFLRFQKKNAVRGRKSVKNRKNHLEN